MRRQMTAMGVRAGAGVAGGFDGRSGNAGPEALAPAEGRVSFRVVWPAAGRLAGAGRRT